jgi:hypothetical protein
MSSSRLAILSIDRSTNLSIDYEYVETISSYRTVGRMLPEVVYLGRDSPAVRDDFLAEVLMRLAIPEERAREIVRDAEHPGAAPDAPVTAVDEPRAPLRQMARNDDWELARMPDREDFWRLTNIGDQQLFPVGAIFSMTRDDRSWTDEVALGMTVPILHPTGSTHMHIVGSDYVANVVVRWRSRRWRFSRLHEWTIHF